MSLPTRLTTITTVLALATAAAPAPVRAATPSPAAEALRLMTIDHHAFLRVKASAPPPFDWSTDGCTLTPPAWRVLFDGACQQHDFGYRNLGHGLALRPTAATRAWVDRRLLTELRRVCAEQFTLLARARCGIKARAMYAAVRLLNPEWSVTLGPRASRVA